MIHFQHPAVLLLLVPLALVAWWLGRPGRPSAVAHSSTDLVRAVAAPASNALGPLAPAAALGRRRAARRRARAPQHRAPTSPGPGLRGRHHAGHRRQRLDAGARHARAPQGADEPARRRQGGRGPVRSRSSQRSHRSRRLRGRAVPREPADARSRLGAPEPRASRRRVRLGDGTAIGSALASGRASTRRAGRQVEDPRAPDRRAEQRGKDRRRPRRPRRRARSA